MTWRQFFARRPPWWIDLAARLRGMMGSGSESNSPERQAQFWEEFRAGQREADLRALEDRKILTPCRENGARK